VLDEVVERPRLKERVPLMEVETSGDVEEMLVVGRTIVKESVELETPELAVVSCVGATIVLVWGLMPLHVVKVS
jgi:hypothetical protein